MQLVLLEIIRDLVPDQILVSRLPHLILIRQFFGDAEIVLRAFNLTCTRPAIFHHKDYYYFLLLFRVFLFHLLLFQ